MVDKSRKKIESMFDEIAPTYDKLNHLFTMKLDLKWRKEIIEYLIRAGVKTEIVLDLASGTGDLTRELFRLQSEKIFSVDISGKMLELQKRKIHDSRLQLVQAEASNLPFDDSTIDVVTIGFGIRNFENIESSLTEICRVMKSGGRLVVLEMFSSDGIKNKIFNIYFGKIMPYVGNKISKSKYAYNYLFESVRNFYSVGDFISMCKKNGFGLERDKDNFLGMVHTVYLKKN